MVQGKRGHPLRAGREKFAIQAGRATFSVCWPGGLDAERRIGAMRRMTTHEFQDELMLPHPRQRVFAFFSDAQNLERITPPWLHFRIETPLPIRLRAGTLIDYRLRVRGFPMGWQTLISVWDPPFRFVDEQKRGPYRLWIHEHRFEERTEGTLVRDQVRYAVWGGRLIERLFVQGDVRRIFAYRRDRISRLLESMETAPTA